MLILKFAIFLISILVPGYLISLFLEKNKPLLYRLALSYGLGVYFITIQIFVYLFIFRLNFSILFFGSVLLLENILLVFYARKSGVLNIAELKVKSLKLKVKLIRGLKIKEAIVILLILIQLIFIFSNALTRPTAAFDSLSMWAYKSKILFYEKQVDFNPDSFLYLGGGGHINYPWLVPLSQFWLHETSGTYNDLAVNLIFVLFFISVLILIYYFLKGYLDKFKSLIFVFFISTMPLFFYHGFNAYADLVLSFYILISFMYLFRWLGGRGNKFLIFAGIFFGISFWVKNEAIIFILASIPPILARLSPWARELNFKNIKILFYYAASIILPILPWLIFKWANGLAIRNVEPGISFHFEAIKPFFGSLFLQSSWNIWWFIAVVALIVNFKKIIKSNELKLGWLFLALSLLGFFILYLFTEEYRYAVDGTAVSRNILTLIPVSVAIVGLSFRNNTKPAAGGSVSRPAASLPSKTAGMSQVGDRQPAAGNNL